MTQICGDHTLTHSSPVQASKSAAAPSSSSHPYQDEEFPAWPPRKGKPQKTEFPDLQPMHDECMELLDSKATRAKVLEESSFKPAKKPLKLSARFAVLDRKPK